MCTLITEENSSDELAMCQVNKQLMIHQLPPVLILHMKRFEIGFYAVTKDSRYISFPEILDMAPYCTVKCLEVIVYIATEIVSCWCIITKLLVTMYIHIHKYTCTYIAICI